MSRFASRAGVAKGKGDGFWSGTAVGASLGLVYAPCAGPILAGVITVSASQSFSTGRLAVALSYGVGSAVVLYLLMLGGRKVVRPLAQRGVGLQIAMGGVMVVVALAMLGNYDIRFQNRIASDLPAFLVNPTEGLEDTASAKSALAEIRGTPSHGIGARAAGQAALLAAAPDSGLPVLGTNVLQTLNTYYQRVPDTFGTTGDQTSLSNQINGLLNILYGLLDPRIRHGRA